MDRPYSWNSPVGTLFRADLTRFWGRRNSGLALRCLAILLVVQLVVVTALDQEMQAHLNQGIQAQPSDTFNPLLAALNAVGLSSGWAFALRFEVAHWGAGALKQSGGVSWWPILIFNLLYVPVKMLLPAFAALSVASDREHRRLSELLLAGFRPGEILAAKGMAALGPFLPLWLLSRVGSEVDQAYSLIYPPAWSGFTGPMWETLVSTLWTSVCTLLVEAALFGLMVCVSALCRRVRTALVGCYALALLWSVLTNLPQLLSNSGVTALAHLRYQQLVVGTLIAAFAAFVVLLPKALQAIQEPDGEVTIPLRPGTSA